MPKALCVFGLVVAALLLLTFGLDLAVGIPFGQADIIMDIGFVIASAILGVSAFLTLREQP